LNAKRAKVEKEATETSVLRLGVSSCLLGEEVRFNGGHKKDGFLLGTLGPYLEWVPVCPEVEIGMGVPREHVRLQGEAGNPLMIAPKSGTDWTERMNGWSRRRVKELERLDLHGYVLKKDSPSCGLFRVKVYDANKVPAKSGRGLFARALTDAMPMLPVEEEGRLHDPRLRENFIERIFVYQRWKRMLAEDATSRGLVEFHTAHKLTLMAHKPTAQTELGRIVAGAGRGRVPAALAEYGPLLMESLTVLSTNRKHANVLYHLLGYLKKHLDREDKEEAVAVIEEYRQGIVPLIVPVTLLKHHLRRHPVPDWVDKQVYLNPYPKELLLRNHV